MTRHLAITNDDKSNELLSSLYMIFVIGSDNQKQTGRESIRLKNAIKKVFDSVSEEGETLSREINEGVTELVLTQQQFEVIDKCFDHFEYRTAFVHKVAECLDWFSAADKKD